MKSEHFRFKHRKPINIITTTVTSGLLRHHRKRPVSNSYFARRHRFAMSELIKNPESISVIISDGNNHAVINQGKRQKKVEDA